MRIAVLLAVALTALTVPALASRNPVVIRVDSVRSNQAGGARFTQMNGFVDVLVLIGNTPLGASQPVKIYRGHCNMLAAQPLYALGNLSGGSLETPLKSATLSELTFHQYSLVVYGASGTRVACGNII